MNILTRTLIKLRFNFWAKLKINSYPSFNLSHSQFGEDMVLRSFFSRQKKGFYVDIGAHHPVYYSNTFHFYNKGWSGINIDASPGSMSLFEVLRPRDKNIEACLGPKDGEDVEFFIFDQPALNTIDKTRAMLLMKEHKLVSQVTCKTQTLASLLERYIPNGKNIDFLSIDAEGLDEVILQGNNWNKFSPQFILFEDHDFDIQKSEDHSLLQYLKTLGYKMVAKTGPSVLVQRMLR